MLYVEPMIFRPLHVVWFYCLVTAMSSPLMQSVSLILALLSLVMANTGTYFLHFLALSKDKTFPARREDFIRDKATFCYSNLEGILDIYFRGDFNEMKC